GYLLSSPEGSFRLANREFQIMEMLMSNPGGLISAERLLEKIWGSEDRADLNVVWVYISYLRKKMQQLHANVQIKATRNTGYTLEVLG
ncbi:MAG: winged helix-turn-helix domain-containing protein, partial [Ruminococcaceae bacterium]|nr:winged helix-turn-helix domain-containing protein [Oscillospiraceae bacterium]